jgi:hypothetical protein
VRVSCYLCLRRHLSIGLYSGNVIYCCSDEAKKEVSIAVTVTATVTVTVTVTVGIVGALSSALLLIYGGNVK